jgi:hypothetical protein
MRFHVPRVPKGCTDLYNEALDVRELKMASDTEVSGPTQRVPRDGVRVVPSPERSGRVRGSTEPPATAFTSHSHHGAAGLVAISAYHRAPEPSGSRMVESTSEMESLS